VSLRHEEEQILVVIDTQRLHRMVVVNVAERKIEQGAEIGASQLLRVLFAIGFYIIDII
jgi:hypothetical protein